MTDTLNDDKPGFVAEEPMHFTCPAPNILIRSCRVWLFAFRAITQEGCCL
jgi:hypothetical protein